MVLALAHPSEPWCFPPGRWFFRTCFTASSLQQQNLSKNCVFSRMSDDTLGTSIYLVYISIGFQTSRLAIFSFIWHQWIQEHRQEHAKMVAAAAESSSRSSSSSSSCFLLWKLFDCSSTTAAPQQQQPPAAAPAAGSRPPQAAAGSSKHQ